MERVFTLADQQAFAEVSGDANPMHLDQQAARRLLFGEAVVHGVHVLLWALELALDKDAPCSFRTLLVRFHRPVVLGRSVRASWARQGDELRLECGGADGVALTATASLDEPVDAPTPGLDGWNLNGCRDWDMDGVKAVVGHRHALDYGLTQEADSLFPVLAKALPPGQLASLLLASQVVGMHCPGSDSLFSELRLTRSDSQGAGKAWYEVALADDRFSFVRLNYATPAFCGTIGAYLRPRPVAQPGMPELAGLVEAGEFAHLRALVVGGSRGLGEVSAKLLAAGGARVAITYHRGAGDARRVVDEIESHAPGACRAVPLDIRDQTEVARVVEATEVPNALLYFATPPILKRPGPFSSEAFQRFCSYYVEGFARLVHALPDGPLAVLYPSSVMVEDIPEELAEYACAKAAGEALCRWLSATRAGLFLECPRFPKLATDQTAGLYPETLDHAAPCLLPVLRSLAQSPGEDHAAPTAL